MVDFPHRPDERCNSMVDRIFVSFVFCTIMGGCLACAPGFLPTRPVETEQVRYDVSHPAWNSRSVTFIGTSLISVACLQGRDGPRISVISVLKGAVTPLGEYSWGEFSPAQRVFFSRPVAPWFDSVLVFAHDDQRNGVVLAFSVGADPSVLWRGSCGMRAEMVYDAGRDSLVVVDHRTLTTIESNSKVEEAQLEFSISRPISFDGGILARAGDGLVLVKGGVPVSQDSKYRRNRVLQVSRAGANAVLMTAHWLDDQKCVEVLSGGPRSRRCQYGRLPEGSWRVRPYRDSAVLWDLDGDQVFLLDCSGFCALQWDVSVSDGMVWATAGNHGLILADDRGYVVLSVR